MDIIVDFDGTCTTHDFPRIGKNIGAVPVLKKLVEKGHKLIIFTMRSDDDKDKTKNYLTQAVKWFEENEIPLYGIQKNPTQIAWTTSPKAYGQMYIDDAALGCPLIFNTEYHSRPYVDWVEVEILLVEKGIL